MLFATSRTSLALHLLAACAAIVSAGCQMDLEAGSQHLSKYDAAKDEYHSFWICTDIVASRAEINADSKKLTGPEHRQYALEHLENLWKDRENIVLIPGPFGPISFIRRENRLLETVSLFQRGVKQEKYKTNFDLKPIRVIPGEMFLSPKETLCYSHHCIFPGKTMDEAFALVMEAINPEIKKGCIERLEARKSGTQTRTSWEAFRREIWNGIEQGQRYGMASSVLAKFPEAVEDASLELLADQGGKQQITLKREAMKFTVQFKLTPADAKELCAAVEHALRGELPDPSKNIAPGQPDPYAAQKKMEAKAAEAFRESKATCDADGKVTMVVELLPILDLIGGDGGPWGYIRQNNVDGMRLANSRADAKDVEARKIPVSRERKVEKLIEEFRGKAGKESEK